MLTPLTLLWPILALAAGIVASTALSLLAVPLVLLLVYRLFGVKPRSDHSSH